MILQTNFKTINEAQEYLKWLYLEYVNSCASPGSFTLRFEYVKDGELYNVKTEDMQKLLKNGKALHERDCQKTNMGK